MKKKLLSVMIFFVVINFNAQKKPNIILLFADDISARELPFYESTVWSKPQNGANTSNLKFRAKTPVLDGLAEKGAFIKTAWASTICGPSRAMMMTGRYAHIHKWWHNKDKGTFINDEGETKKNIPLFLTSPHTISHVAKAGGYATYWAGKTQMDIGGFNFDEACFTPGSGDVTRNTSNKFSDFKILLKKVKGGKGKKRTVLINQDTGAKVDYYQQFGWYWKPHVELMNHPSSKEKFQFWPNTKESKASYGLNTFGPDIELDFIFDFMTRKKKENKPFFIYHTSHLGHDGWNFFSSDVNKKTRDKWPGTPKIKWENNKYTRTSPNVTGDKGIYNTHGTVTKGGIHNHVNYLDYQVWLYMNKLKELGEEDNTVFIFCADNGTSGYGKSSPVSQKGTHVPFMIYAPCLNMTKQGEQNILVNLSDVLPTIADIAGVKFPKHYEINGKSLIPYLTTKKTKFRDWIYSYHKEMQMIRGEKILSDGNGTIYDISKTADDLISYEEITDWSKFSHEHLMEAKKLRAILPQYDLHETEHDAPLEQEEVEPLIVR